MNSSVVIPQVANAPSIRLALEAEVLDTVPADTLAVCLCADVRPLAGLADLLDWRLCGRLTSLLMAGTFVGQAGETMLLGVHERLPKKRVVVFGCGSRAGLEMHVDDMCRWMVQILDGVQAGRVAIGLPEPSTRLQSVARTLLPVLLADRFAGIFDEDPRFAG